MNKTQIDKLKVVTVDLWKTNPEAWTGRTERYKSCFKVFRQTVNGYGPDPESSKSDLLTLAYDALADFDTEKNWHPSLDLELCIERDEQLAMMGAIDQDIAYEEEDGFLISTFETLEDIQKNKPEELEEFLKDEKFKSNYDKILEWNRFLWNREFK